MNRVNQKYAYVSHPENLPLELNGNSKKRMQPLNRQDFNEEKCKINEESRSLIMKKMSANIHDFTNNKSILPRSDQRKKGRPSSIKTFKEDKQNMKGSGIEYLLMKTENVKPTTHKEKAHVKEVVLPESKINERKHFIAEQEQTWSEEARRQVRHRQTHDVKLAKDIYSNPLRLERQGGVGKKLEERNLFKNGVELGLEDKRVKKCSDNKMIEMMGSDHVMDKKIGVHVVDKKGGLRERRQDWRTSNINFF